MDKIKDGLVDEQVLRLKGLGNFGDELIYMPVEKDAIKRGLFNQEAQSDNSSEASDDEEENGHQNDHIKKMQLVIKYLWDKDDAPWVEDIEISPNSFVKLHNEILYYFDYYGPSEKLKTTSLGIFNNLSKIIVQHNPKWRIEVIGAYSLGYYSVNSPMDITILLPENPKKLKHVKNWDMINVKEEEDAYILSEIEALQEVLEEHFGPIKSTNCNKYKKLSWYWKGIKIEIRFNEVKQIQAKFVLRKFFVRFPEAKFLMVIIKELLRSRELHDIQTGGMDSFTLSILIISYFLESEKENGKMELLLWEHLLNFLDFYGNKFNYKYLTIWIRAGGWYYARDDKGWKHLDENPNSISISIENPLDPLIDLGKKITNMKQIQIAFAYAFETVLYNSKSQKSFLKCFLLKNPKVTIE
jgi:non-canonical poly(A) RNA polymerase PAPD5/7